MTDTAAAILLAGGRGTRLGGADKAALALGESTFLDLLVTSLASTCAPLIVVGPTPTMPLSHPVLTTQEQPPGGGPLAGIAAGIDLVPSHTTWCAVVACDTPFGARAFPDLFAATHHNDADAFLATDSTGRPQPLVALYRVAPLRRAVTALNADNAVVNQPVRRLFTALSAHHVAVHDVWTRDVDTPDDLIQLRHDTTNTPPQEKP